MPKRQRSSFDDAVDAMMEPIRRYQREQDEANRRPFLYSLIQIIQVSAALLGMFVALVALFDVFAELMRLFYKGSFWFAVACGIVAMAAEWALRRLPATERERRLRKSSSSN